MKKFLCITAIMLSAVMFSSCGKDDVSESEEIAEETTVITESQEKTEFNFDEYSNGFSDEFNKAVDEMHEKYFDYNYVNINMEVIPLDYESVEIPDDYIEISAEGLSFSVPPDMENKGSSILSVYRNKKNQEDSQSGSLIMFMSSQDWSDINYSDFSDLSEVIQEKFGEDIENQSEENLKKAFASFDYDYTGTRLSLIKGVLGITEDELTDDNAEDFRTLAILKEFVLGLYQPKVYTMEKDGVYITAFQYNSEATSYFVVAYPDENTEICAMLRSYEPEILNVMLASANIA